MKQKQNISFTLILATFLVVVLSFVFPKNDEKYMSELFGREKRMLPKKYDIVLMGDSRMYRGLSPAKMNAILPDKKILNFAYSNGGLNTTMFAAAKDKLAENGNPKIIVLGISANTITGYSVGNEQYLQELYRSREEILERFYLNPLLFWFSSTSPEEIKNELKNAEETSFYRNTYFMNGFVESEKFPTDTTEAISSYIKDFTNYKVEKRFVENLFVEIKNLTADGIIVVAFRPPVSQPMKMLEDSLALYNEQQIKSGIQYAGGHWIDLNFTHYKTYDGSHLNIESSGYLSDKIATEIQTILAK